MRALKLLFVASILATLFGCEGLPEPKEVDQGKVDRAMEQVENGKE